jgi:hypothetical protein
MSDFTFRGKAPQPIEYSSQKLRITPGSPARQRPSGNASQKVEFRGAATSHTMGKRSGQTLAVAPPASTQPPKAGPAPGKAHGSVASGAQPKVTASPEAAITPATPVPPIFSQGAAMLIGQLLEGYIWNELMGPRAESPMTYSAKEALEAIQPLLPKGVSIPVPVVTPEMAAQMGIAAAAAPTPATQPAHQIETRAEGFACVCGETFPIQQGATQEQIAAAAQSAGLHATPASNA